MKRLVVWLIIGSGVLLGGWGIYWSYHLARETAEFSAVRSLHAELLDALEAYRQERGEYPEHLHMLEVDFADTDGASEETLDLVHYERKDGSFVLVPPAFAK